MGTEEHALVKALMTNNEEMRVIAVGDDDQNIYEFRGSDSDYMYRLAQETGSTFVEMTENYRSARQPVDFANGFLKTINKRIKKYTYHLYEKRERLGGSDTSSFNIYVSAACRKLTSTQGQRHFVCTHPNKRRGCHLDSPPAKTWYKQ